jgi:hypothetical protein
VDIGKVGMLWSAGMRRCGWMGIGLLLASAFALAAIGCGGGATTVTTAAKPVEQTAAQIKEKAAAEAEAHKQQVAQAKEEAHEAAEKKKHEAHEAAEQKKHEAHEQAQEAAESSSAGSSSSGGGQTVPSDIVNKKLEDAESELNSQGISFTTNSYGKIVILKGDWGVCSTSPEPGQPVSGTVVLNLGHFSCGV